MPTTYLSPGVYVEEVPSGSAPIAGVGTSTAGFIGVTSISPKKVTEESVGNGEGAKTRFDLYNYPVSTTTLSFTVKVGGTKQESGVKLENDDINRKSSVVFDTAPASGAAVVVDYEKLLVSGAGEVKLCTNFSEFSTFFGGFSTKSINTLAHAVYGFFNNGGTRCYVVWVAGEADIAKALESFEAIDEIAIVAAPGVTSKEDLNLIKDHCEKLGDRFAILDSPETVEDTNHKLDLTKFAKDNAAKVQPDNSQYAAFYFPWIKVFDPASKSEIYVPPSGHMAGIYARVDTKRGVHKAPANETVMGAVGLKYNISKAQQDGLNPKGINCIRSLNGNIRVWGARTLGGDDNGEFKYINVRRLFNFLRESIDEGTQWAVFEPNSPELWAKIRRNVTAFLMTVWRSGALFGTAPEQAFFVKCDEETNPPDVRDAGQVVTIIGVAVVKPAEFVIFRISQWAGPGGS